MKPPTEEQLNEEVDDGYGLQWQDKPTWLIQADLNLLQSELDALEMTYEMTTDRWNKERGWILTMIQSYINSIEFETEWTDEVDEEAVARDQLRLQEYRTKLRVETEEYEQGAAKAKEAIKYKGLQIAVAQDALKRSLNGHF